MKFKGTVALTVAFIGIVLYYFLIDVPTEERKKEEKIRSEKVLPFDSDDVESLSIIEENKTIVLKRSSKNAWQMTKPVTAKGDPIAISTFLSFLSDLDFTRIVEESAKNLDTFGLHKPTLKIIISTKSGKTKGIQVGDDHPIGNKIYLTRLNEDKVFTVDISRDRLYRQAYDLRDKTILDFETSQIKKIELIINGKELAFKKTEQSWHLSEEKNTAKGDENKIINFLNTIKTAKIKRFVEEHPEELNSFGLDNPKLVVKLTEQDRNNSSTLFVGKKVDSESYAKSLSKDNIFLIDQLLFDSINSSRLVDFMDNSLVDFNNEDLTKITLRTGDEIAQLTRDKKDSQNWTIEKPLITKASSATVNSLLFDLKGMHIVEFINTSTEDKELHGLSHPEKKITLGYKNGKTWTLTVGNQTSSSDHNFAKRTDETAIFTLKKSAIESIFRSLHDLRDRTLFKFNNDEIHEIKIRNPKQTFILKKTKNKWKLTQPESIDRIKGFISNDILWALSSLEFESILSTNPNSVLTGLNNPLLSVELLNKNSAVLAHVLVGKPVAKSPELHYLKIDKNPNLYTVKKRILDEIPSDIKKFKR